MRFSSKLFIILFVSIISASLSCGDEQEKDNVFSIDYELLSNNKRAEAKEIVEENSVTRSLKGIEFKINEPVLLFMVDNPAFLSATLRAMNIGNYVIEHEKDATYSYDDGKGLNGKFDLVYSEHSQRYYCGSGEYDGLLLNLIGKGLVLTRFYTNQEYPNRVYLDANVYAKIENIVLSVLVKILKPIVIPLIDRKINKFIGEFQELLNEIVLRPEKIYQSIKETGYASDKDLEEFKKIVEKNKDLYT